MKRKPWRKVLYERQDYPDNYVDGEKFLDELDMNPTQSPLTFLGAFVSTSVVIQQMTAVAIFIAIHKYIVKHESFVWLLFVFDGILLICIHLVQILLGQSPDLLYTLKSSLLFLICLRVIAPALQTLTSSYSDDTIDALVIIFSTIHLVFHDYAYVNNSKEIFSGLLVIIST